MNYHCNGFHDFFLVGFDYRAGDFITENGSHAFGHAEDFVLTLRFAGWSIINHPTIELCFTGVRRFNVANGEYFMNEIFGAYTELRDDLDENKRQYVVWTDDWIDPNNLNSEIIMNNRSPTYTVANKMECRIIYI